MELTEDSIWRKDVRILQPKRGFRFGIDAVLLAHFLEIREQDRVLEIGTGSGVIPVLAWAMGKRPARLLAVEIQRELAALAHRNFQANGVASALAAVADARRMPAFSNSFNLLYTNPPYRKIGHGRLNPSAQKATARHELSLKLEDLLECAGRFLAPGGRLSVILPGFRQSDFDRLTALHGYRLARRRFVHSFAGEPPAFFLATVCNAGAPVGKDEPPLVIYDAPARYTAEAEKMLTEK